LSSWINLTNTILGSGMLAMPSALAGVGMGLGIFLVGLSAAASAFGLLLLTRVATEVGGRRTSFFACSKATYPKAGVVIDLAIAVKCFGVSISYLVLCGKLLPQVVDGFAPDTPLDSPFRKRELWITLCTIFIAPVNFAKRLDSLRYTSAFALTAVIYLLFIVVSFFISPPEFGMPPRPTWGDITWVRIDSKFLNYFPIFVFAFTCHQNIFSVYNELVDNTSKQVEKVISRSIGTAFSTYEVIGILGYLTFGDTVTSVVISHYPPGPLITCGQLAIAVLVLLSFPLQLHPCRASFDKVISCGSSEVGSMSMTRWVSMTAAITTAAYFLAMTVKDLATVLALVGATGSTTICYILPGLFYNKM
ncbi:transmembrane amino acid transporter protein-domain-containing protein, partial [Blyttiomyces helicus]